MEEKIRAALEKMRKMLQADGGDLEIVAVNGTKAQLRLRGACGCCPHAAMTLKNGIERALRDDVDPTITVERVE